MKTILETSRKESRKSKSKRLLFNWFPAYRRTGGRIIFCSEDWKEVQVRLRLNFFTRNYVGSVFGGSIYGAMDPIYMIQLIRILGKEYVVWDKSAQIRFIRPIRKTVYARFEIREEELLRIREEVARNGKCTIDFTTAFQDETGVIYAEVIKTIYIAGKAFYNAGRKPGK